MYREAGADMLFVEAPKTRERTGRIGDRVGRVAAADGEHGRRRQDADPARERAGSARLRPRDLSRRHRARARPRRRADYYGSLDAHGTTEPFRARMFDFDGLNALIGTPEMMERGRRYEAQAAAGPRGRKPMSTLDPVTLAVLNGRLVQIADEMDATLYRSAFNPIIAEAHDACHGLYHAETGATLVQGTSGLPIFVGAMAFAVKAVIDKVDTRRRPRAKATLICSTILMTAARISTISVWCGR